ncbi:MAG: glycosyltransferase [Verrucomicrobia bacterium]|nr:glycosyltransferase [Verrucomicrobiota bacterium]MBU6446327.1 glycosyltransferase [Verrucomicrobiota bacterium]MDE3047879.1 glycosyltransferase [Verrucomicrobiota bacterium]
MWVLPTYDRPERAQKTLDSIAQSGCTTPGLVYIDGNQKYPALHLPKGWSVWQNELNRGVCAALNDVFARFPNCPWYGFMSDDSLVRTPFWDQRLLAQMDDYSIVHSADGWRSEERIHGAVVFGGELLRALQWWVPDGLVHSFCDDVWESIAHALHLRRYVPEVMVEHCHFGNQKAPVDFSYLKAYQSFDQDQQAFLKWKEMDFQAAIERVQKRQNGSPRVS